MDQLKGPCALSRLQNRPTEEWEHGAKLHHDQGWYPGAESFPDLENYAKLW